MGSVTEMMEVIGESAGVKITISWTGIRLILNVWAVSCFEWHFIVHIVSSGYLLNSFFCLVPYGYGGDCIRDVQCQFVLGSLAECSVNDNTCHCRQDTHLGYDNKCHNTIRK